mmetsp:Transcript_9773/g.16091  ORF Transcript_9773/g.16091 Transcript_9773/m.16091 type:complete len:155 (-) Transcript_9773:12-476(-)
MAWTVESFTRWSMTATSLIATSSGHTVTLSSNRLWAAGARSSLRPSRLRFVPLPIEKTNQSGRCNSRWKLARDLIRMQQRPTQFVFMTTSFNTLVHMPESTLVEEHLAPVEAICPCALTLSPAGKDGGAREPLVCFKHTRSFLVYNFTSIVELG